MNLKPLSGYVLVEIEVEEQRKEGSLILPESSQEKPSKGKVVAVGSDWLHQSGTVIEPPVELIGKTVVFRRWTESPLKEDGKDYALVPFESLQGVYE